MATWVTHLIIADKVMEKLSDCDRRGFSVGNIAPDCNVENADWTAFTPPREVTHWMSDNRKVATDSDKFYNEYILNKDFVSKEHYWFLLGYYAHLITDASFQWFVRDEKRIEAVWERIKANENLSNKAAGMPETWDLVKKLIPFNKRMNEIYSMEAEYLKEHPDSAYITEILPLKEFPDYIDYLPHGCIVRKIGVMGYMPKVDENLDEPITLSREEYWKFIENTVELVLERIVP